jgi:hypothetical protein
LTGRGRVGRGDEFYEVQKAQREKDDGGRTDIRGIETGI